MTHLVVLGGPGTQFFSLESHPTILLGYFDFLLKTKIHLTVRSMMMIWCLTSLSTLFKSNIGDGRVIMKGSVQRNALVET